MARYAEGQDLETHTESLTRRINQLESKLEAISTQFREVKPGPNLTEDFLKMKREVLGADSNWLAYWHRLYEVDMNLRREIKSFSTEHCILDDNGAQLTINGVPYVFQR